MTRGLKMRIALALAFLGFSHSLQIFEDVDNIVLIDNKKDLASQVLESSSLMLVGAFSDDPEECPGCEKISKEFTKAAKNLATYGVKTIAVDCTGAIPACHGMTKDLMLTNIPFVRSYVAEPMKNPYTKKWGREGVTFDGNADSRSLQKHVLNKIPSVLLERQTSESFPPSSDGKSLVLLFTERESPSVLIKSLSYHFKNRLNFAEVSDVEESLMENFAVTKTPTMLVTFADKSKQDSNMGVVYKGDPKNWNEMIAFLEPFALKQEQTSSGSDSSTQTNDEDSKKSKSQKTISSHAILLDDLNFQSEVLSSPEAWAVLYHPPQGTISKKDESKYDAWKKTAEKFSSQGPMMKIGEVNCSTTPNLCSSLTNMKKAQIIIYDYHGNQEGSGIKRNEIDVSNDIFPLSECNEACESVSQSIPDKTYKMNSGNMDQIASEAIQQDKILLFLASNKDEPPFMLKQLAIELNAVAIVAFLPSPDTTMMQQFQIERLPTFVSMYPQPAAEAAPGQPPGGIQFGMARFDPRRYGKPTFDSVFSFSVQVAMSVNPKAVERLSQEKEQQKSGFGSTSSGLGSTSSGPVSEITDQTWLSQCDPKSSKLCAIAFLSGGGTSSSFQHELDIAQTAFNAHANDPYNFMWVNGACQSEFTESFDVQPNQYPTVVVYSPKKNRFASFVGTYDSEAIRDLLSGVLSGRVKTREVFQLTPPQDRDCSNFNDGSNDDSNDQMMQGGGEEDDDDMSDMMAEILAEEAKRKEELAAELKAEAAEKKQKALEDAKKKEEESKKASKKKKKKKNKKKNNEL